MASGNEVLWSVVRKECLLEQMRRQDVMAQLEDAPARRPAGLASLGRRLRLQMANLLSALGRRLEGAAASLAAGGAREVLS